MTALIRGLSASMRSIADCTSSRGVTSPRRTSSARPRASYCSYSANVPTGEGAVVVTSVSAWLGSIRQDGQRRGGTPTTTCAAPPDTYHHCDDRRALVNCYGRAGQLSDLLGDELLWRSPRGRDRGDLVRGGARVVRYRPGGCPADAVPDGA